MQAQRGTLAGVMDALELIGFDAQLSAAELETRARVRALVDEHVRPNIGTWWERGEFTPEVVPAFAAAGLFGMHLQGYGCAGRSAVEYGLACAELEAADSGVRTLVSVQGSLAMTAIHHHGSEEQKQQWLPRMAAGEALGCFALTEPTAGSDPASMRTRAVRDGDDWVLTGSKRWIGLASAADVAVVWAQTEDGVRGFLVPTASDGFTATPIGGKLSLRASVQCDIELDAVRVPESSRLPGAIGLKAALECLNEARYGIAWGVMGAAHDSFRAALGYTLQREQFGKPVAAFQLTQAKLADQAAGIAQGFLLALHLGRMKDAGTLQPHQISAAKLANVRTAIGVARDTREMLGGNGITLDHSPMRHAVNLESVRTYEGTDEVHQLVIGAKLTGLSAFG